jgi:uncharacterized protein (TIGR00299 family) protein
MRTLYLDTIAGIAGDMFLALMFDLGVDPEIVKSELTKLNLDGYHIDIRSEKRCGIAGTYFDITIDENQPARTWQSIDQMIAEADLTKADKELARRIFKRLGEAEAKVHGVGLEQVHFHEVGAVDSIIDIVGAAIAVNRLGVEQILCAPLPLGQGTIKTDHGTYPLPAPATLEVLKGYPIRPDDSGLELVTPTGAAIAAELATFIAMPEMTIEAIGHGLGSRDMPERPNVLRGIIGDTAEVRAEDDRVTVIETHLDDGNPEWLGYLMEKLFTAGALDVAWTPLQMKKNRPGTRLAVICDPADRTTMERLILRDSSAIGVRAYETRRRKLQRENCEVRTELGTVQVKCLYDDDALVRVTPEFESCRQLAEQKQIPLPEVYRLAERAADELFNKGND